MAKKRSERDATADPDERLVFVRQLISIFEDSNLSRLEYEDEDVALALERNPKASPADIR
ncbi:MAG: hypothetical protein HYV07_15720 [Deltaproteobacteria bacterium]|nr:hypothetical protein [Deltaproteobacteria bacterium]